MSEHETHEHTSFIKTPGQLIVVVVLSFVIPIFLIVLLAKLAFHSLDTSGTAQSEEAVAKRLKPIGEVVVADGPIPPQAQAAAPTTPPAAAPAGVAAPAAAAAGSSDAGRGKAVHDSACMVCHGAGIAGAPKTGDKAAWAPRLKQGAATLHGTALKGKGAMPPKGGNPALSDADVMAAVDYMVNQSK